MLSFPSHTDIFLCHTPVSFGCGIDGMVRYCRLLLRQEALGRGYFLFINKRRTQIRVLWYDGQGFSLCTKRCSVGTFRFWPKSTGEVSSKLLFWDAGIVFSGGVPVGDRFKSLWKQVG